MALPFNAGDWVLVDFGGNAHHYDSSDTHLETLYGGGLGGFHVRGAAFDADRNLYLAFQNNRIDKFLADGTGPTTIYDSSAVPFWGPLGLEVSGSNLYFSTSNTGNDPRIVRLDLDGNFQEELVVVPDNGTITYDDNLLFGLSADGTKLYGQYGELDGATITTKVWETPVATDVPAVVFSAAAPSSTGAAGDFDDIVPLLDGSFAVMHVTGSTNPIIKKYDNAWAFVEDLISEGALGTIVVNGVTHTAPSGFYAIDETIMFALSPDETKLLVPIINPSDNTTEVWEYDLAAKTIGTKHVADTAGAAVRSFAFTAGGGGGVRRRPSQAHFVG